MPLLAALYPRARFVHLVRDPRDCVLSTQDAWGNTPLRTAQEWADRVRALPRGRRWRSARDRYLELRYEDLVGDVRGHLAAVFDFLGVPTPPDAGQFLRVPENLGSARGADRGGDPQPAEVEADHAGRHAPRHRGHRRRPARRPTATSASTPACRSDACPAARMAAYRVRDAWRQLQFRRKEQGGWVRGLRFLLAR